MKAGSRHRSESHYRWPDKTVSQSKSSFGRQSCQSVELAVGMGAESGSFKVGHAKQGEVAEPKPAERVRGSRSPQEGLVTGHVAHTTRLIALLFYGFQVRG